MSLVAPQIALASGSVCPEGKTKRVIKKLYHRDLVSENPGFENEPNSVVIDAQVSVWNSDFPLEGIPGVGFSPGVETTGCIDDGLTTSSSEFSHNESIDANAETVQDEDEPHHWFIISRVDITETITYS